MWTVEFIALLLLCLFLLFFKWLRSLLKIFIISVVFIWLLFYTDFAVLDSVVEFIRLVGRQITSVLEGILILSEG